MTNIKGTQVMTIMNCLSALVSCQTQSMTTSLHIKFMSTVSLVLQGEILCLNWFKHCVNYLKFCNCMGFNMCP